MKTFAKLISLWLLYVGLPLMAGGGGDGHGGYDWGHFVPWLVNATIFFGGLGYILKKPASDFFRKRREEIEQSLSKAERSVAEANAQLEKIEAENAALEKEVRHIIDQAKQDAEQEKQRMLAQVEEEVARIHEQAGKNIANMEREAKAELKAFLADVAVTQAEKIVKTTMTDAERGKVFQRFTAQLGAKS